MAEPGPWGGFFPLEPWGSRPGENTRIAHLKGANGYYNARSAIWSLISFNSTRDVILPRYICPVVFRAVEQAGAEARAFSAAPDLTFDYSQLERMPGDRSLLVIPYYFGVRSPDLDALASIRRKTGCSILLDCAQALYEPCPDGFAAVYSPRKFLGVPDGGFLAVGRDSGLKLPEKPSARVGHAVFGERLACHGVRREYPDADCLESFRSLENGMPCGNIGMSDLAMAIFTSFDHDRACERRITNYDTLSSLLGEPLARCRSVPMCFPMPIRPEVFERVRHDLIEQGVFIPYYWPGDDEWMSPGRGVLAFPVDHRYDPGDMAELSDRAMRVLHGRSG